MRESFNFNHNLILNQYIKIKNCYLLVIVFY